MASRSTKRPITRTPAPADLDVPRDIVAVAENHSAAGRTGWHSHPRGQLLYAERGTITTTAEEGTWVAPPDRALWMPADFLHITAHSTGTKLRMLFIARDAVTRLPARCAVIQMNPLLREIYLAVGRLPHLYDENGADGRLVRVLLDQLTPLPAEALHLPMPASSKLRSITKRIMEQPDRTFTVAEAARELSMSPRTFARQFLASTGLTWGVWQRQAKMLRALELLGAGARVGEVADSLGYEGTSSFIAAFRKSFETTPARYFSAGPTNAVNSTGKSSSG